jgi:hypothetical protein
MFQQPKAGRDVVWDVGSTGRVFPDPPFTCMPGGRICPFVEYVPDSIFPLEYNKINRNVKVGVPNEVSRKKPCTKRSDSGSPPPGLRLSQCASPRHRPVLAKKDLDNPCPVSFKSPLITPGFCSKNSIQPSPFPLAVSYIMSKGHHDRKQDRTKNKKPENPGGTFLFLPNSADI